jgi:hypothetical protein
MPTPGTIFTGTASAAAFVATMSVSEVTSKRIMQAFLALGFVSLNLACDGDAQKRYSHKTGVP